MIELGELERNHADFEQRKVDVVVISNDDQATSALTQSDFPHLVVISDADQNMAKAFEVIHPGAAPDATDTNAPTTFLLDGTGRVKWFARPDRFIVRFSPQDLIAAIEK